MMEKGGRRSAIWLRIGVITILLIVVGSFAVRDLVNRATRTAEAERLASEHTARADLIAKIEAETNPDQLLIMGRHLQTIGKLDLAIVAVRQATELAPNHRDVHIFYAWLLLDNLNKNANLVLIEDQVHEAQAAVETAKKLDPLSPYVRELETILATVKEREGTQ